MPVDWVRIEGDSMRPFIEAGDLLGVRWDQGGNFKLGDILLARAAAKPWIVHRLVGYDRKTSGRLLVKGDAAYVFETFAPELVWGHIIAIRRKGSARVCFWRVSWLDRAIAHLSRWRLRRVTFALGFLRRNLLWSK